MGRSATHSLLPKSDAPAIGSPTTITPPPSSETLPKRARQLRRRIKTLPFPAGRRSGPATPHLRWKLNDAERTVTAPEQRGQGGKGLRPDASVIRAGPATAFSARKLAAALWHLQEVVSEPDPRHLHLSKVFDHGRTSQYPCIVSKEHVCPIPISPEPKATLQKLEASATFLSFAMEKATKWDAECLRSAQEAYQSRGLQLHKDPLTTASVISALQAELERARYCVHKLKNENESAKKKLNHFLKKLADERVSWQSREQEKVRNTLRIIRHDLDREKKSRKRMEIVNSKLVNELAAAKLSAKQYFQDYEKERKAREVIEEVCDGLAKEMGDERAEVESLKRESLKIREELDEERRMLQMAEVWREERVQMKLVDAKITLEEKYAEMIKLQDDLDSFLRLHAGSSANMPVVRDAEALRESVSLLKFQDVVFPYQPPPSSGDIFSVLEEFDRGEAAVDDGKTVGGCCGYSPASHTSQIPTASPETDIFLEDPTMMYENEMIIGNEDAEDDSGLETMSYAEGQGSCSSPVGSNLSANGGNEESRLPVGAEDWDLRRKSHTVNSEGSEVCSRTTGQSNSRKKVSSLGKFWWSSSNSKKSPARASNGKLTDSRMLNAAMSPDMNSGEVDSSSPSVCLQRPSDSVKKSDICRGARGCTEWPTEMEDRSLKKKLLEARKENDKFQLRHVLKHKS